ncbi:MAG TPA: hypothetical protein VH302_11960 [Bryobacteraceae bacterium]|nr:hypothetical protein [Bryobacteraceae bacterium]
MAQPTIQRYSVPNAQVLEAQVTSYLAQGYIVANRTADSVTLQKKKEFNVLWAVVGFVLCLLPLLIYLIVYVTKPDVEIVEIVIVPHTPGQTDIQPVA